MRPRVASLLPRLFVLISSPSTVSQERGPSGTDVLKRPQHPHSFDTPPRPLHLYVPHAERSPSGNRPLHMHQATSVFLISVFEPPPKRGPVCVYRLIKYKVSSGHLLAPDCVSARLTAGERGKHQETLLSHPDLCFDESHQTMSISKRPPQREKKLGEVVCVCGR